jgi:hypothetical protein
MLSRLKHQFDSLVPKLRPTQRAADVWESARFTGFFLAWVFLKSQALSTPAHTQLTQAVSPPAQNCVKRINIHELIQMVL